MIRKKLKYCRLCCCYHLQNVLNITNTINLLLLVKRPNGGKMTSKQTLHLNLYNFITNQ